MSDHIERFPYIDDALEFEDAWGRLVISVPWPKIQGPPLPPGWVKHYNSEIPRKLVYEGPPRWRGERSN